MTNELSARMHAAVGLPTKVRILGVAIDGSNHRYMGELPVGLGEHATFWKRAYIHLKSIYDHQLIRGDMFVMEWHWYVNNMSVLTHRKDKNSLEFLTPEQFCEGVIEALEVIEARKRSMKTVLFSTVETAQPAWEDLI